MRVLVVYCHPSSDSFTYRVKEAFCKALERNGHQYTVSDLYAEGFSPAMSEDEYLREGYYQCDTPVQEDVLREQKRINEADAIVFIYPVFWTSSPAMLEGWFQRVWTYGFAYGDNRTMKTLDKAVFLITMGGSLTEELRRIQVEAMKTVMIGDRISDRARHAEFHVFDEMSRGEGNGENRSRREVGFLDKCDEIASSF